MKKIPENKKSLILYYWDLGMSVSAITIILKISETSVKTHLKLNNRNGPPPKFTQAYNTWRYSNQQNGEQGLNYPSNDDQQREQQPKEKQNEQEGRITQLTDDLQKAYDREQNQKQESEKKTKELEQKNKDNEDLKQEKKQLFDELKTEKRINEDLKDKVNKQYERIIEIERELGEQKIKVYKAERDTKELEKEYNKTLEKLDNGVTDLISALTSSRELNKDLTDDRDRYKNEVTRLERDQDNAWIEYLLSFTVGITLGVGGFAIYQKYTSQSPVTLSDKPGNNTQYYAPPISGAMKTNASGIQCSGIIITNYGKTTSTGCNARPIIPISMIPAIQPLDNSVTPVTITSGIPCSGALSHPYGHIDTGYPVHPNPQDVSEVSIENPSIIPCSGPFFSSHLETIGFTL